MEEEIWKDIEELDNLYEISNMGRIRNKRNAKIISIKNSKGWYLCLTRYINQKTIAVRPHQLVAKYFLNKKHFKSMPYENRNEIDFNILQVNHKDENLQNNCINNLEWCTPKYNANYGTRNERMKKQKILKYGKKIRQYDLNGNYIRTWRSISEIKDSYNYHYASIINCCKGKYKQSYGYIWQYESDVKENGI